MIHVFSDVIHVSTLLDIRLFLTIFGFSKPKLGGGYTNVVPPRLRSRFCLRCCSHHYSAIGSALPFQCFREEIALQDQQIFSDGFVIGHMRDAGQRQERVLASGRHQRLAQA